MVCRIKEKKLKIEKNKIMNNKLKIISILLFLVLLIGLIFRYSRTQKISMGKGLFLIVFVITIIGMIMYVYKKNTL